MQIIPGSDEAIRLLNTSGSQVIVVSNQSGVAKGYYEELDIGLFNDEIKQQLSLKGAHIDALYYCPHHPDAIIEKYKSECRCRKPNPGMIINAAKEHDVDLRKSYVIGDKWSDIEAGKNAGCQPILVLTGHGTDELSKIKDPECPVAADLYEAVNTYILEKSNPRDNNNIRSYGRH